MNNKPINLNQNIDDTIYWEIRQHITFDLVVYLSNTIYYNTYFKLEYTMENSLYKRLFIHIEEHKNENAIT